MTTLHGNPVTPNFNDGEKLSAAEFNAVKNYWVTDELPETAENGDVVFVVESDPFDPNATPGLPGLGGWATITAVSGIYKKPRYEYNDGPGGVGGTDWVAYEFTDDGTLTTQAGGLVEALLVSGGGSSSRGNGGVNAKGFYAIEKTNVVSVGKGGVVNASYTPVVNGGRSVLGPVSSSPTGVSRELSCGMGSGALTGGDYSPVTSSITGTQQTYGASIYSSQQGASTTGFGDSPGINNPGNNGVVIVRVPKDYANGVSETRHGWLNFATVENGVVTSVNKTPDNIPYTTAVDEFPCDPEVAEGWNYDGSEFIAPEPDYSDQIKELEETLKNLRSAK